jgi:hypothetical protein
MKKFKKSLFPLLIKHCACLLLLLSAGNLLAQESKTKSWKSERSILRSESSKSWLNRKLKSEALFHIVDTVENEYLLINPVGAFLVYKEKGNSKKLHTNVRGFDIKGQVGKKFSFYSRFEEIQSFFPTPIDTFALYAKTLPGYGRIKKFKETGFDYSLATGHIEWKATEKLTLELGQESLKLGKGYRSVFLSDHIYPTPYYSIQFKHKNWTYKSTYMSTLQNSRYELFTTSEPLLEKTSSHITSIAYRRGKWGISFVDLIQVRNTASAAFSAHIPLPSSLLGLPNTRNTFGINADYSPVNKVTIYAQIANGSGNNAQQLGIAAEKKLCSIIFEGRFEFNKSYNDALILSDYTSSSPQQLGLKLGLPYSNLREAVAQLKVSWKSFKISSQFNQKLNSHKFVQPYTNSKFQNLELSWLPNNFNQYGIKAGITKGALMLSEKEYQFIYFGIVTNFTSPLTDF